MNSDMIENRFDKGRAAAKALDTRAKEQAANTTVKFTAGGRVSPLV
jgi:hypothetical protein